MIFGLNSQPYKIDHKHLNLLKNIEKMFDKGFDLDKIQATPELIVGPPVKISNELDKLFKDIFQVDYINRISYKELIEVKILKDKLKNHKFYLSVYNQNFPNLSRLQSKYQIELPDDLEESEELKRTRKRRLTKIGTIIRSRKHERMESSLEINLHSSIKEANLDVNVYSYLRDRCLFIQFLMEQLKVIDHEEVKKRDTLVLRYYLNLLQHYYLFMIKWSMDHRENLFELNNWNQLSQSDFFLSELQIIAREEAESLKQLQNLKNEIMLFREQIESEILQGIDWTFQPPETYDYKYLIKYIPDKIKLPLRACILKVTNTLLIRSKYYQDQFKKIDQKYSYSMKSLPKTTNVHRDSIRSQNSHDTSKSKERKSLQID